MPSLVHKDVGPALTFSEYHDQSAHIISGGAPGDMLFFDGNSLVRLPIGASDQVLAVRFGIPTWIPAPGGGSGTSSSIVAQSTIAFTVARANPNYALQVDTNDASSTTGIRIGAHPATFGLTLNVLSTATDENLFIDAKGIGNITLGRDSTGGIVLNSGTTMNGGFDSNGNGDITGSLTVSSNLAVNGITSLANGLSVPAGGIDVSGNDITISGLQPRVILSHSPGGETYSIQGMHLTAFNEGGFYNITTDRYPWWSNSADVMQFPQGFNSAATSSITGNLTVTGSITGGSFVGITPPGTADIDMQNFLILNIGNAGTDFTSTGGLNLAGSLVVNGASITVTSGTISVVGTIALVASNAQLAIQRTGAITSRHVFMPGYAGINNQFSLFNSNGSRYPWFTDANDVMHFPQGFASEAASSLIGDLTITGGITNTVSSVTASQTWVNTDPGGVGVRLSTYHNSASPIAGDTIFRQEINGNDIAGAQVTYARIDTIISDTTVGSTDATLVFNTVLNGVLNTGFQITGLSAMVKSHLALFNPVNVTWGANWNTIDFNREKGAIGFDLGNGTMSYMLNMYYDGTNYKNTANAAVSMMTQLANGNTGWYASASPGAANTTFTPTPIMTLTSTGNLSIIGALTATNFPGNLDSLTDVSIVGPTGVQLLAYNGSLWLNQPVSALITLDNLTDVIITAPANNQHLVYNGTNWVNTTPAASGMTNPMTTAGDIIVGGASGTPTRLGIGSNTQVLTLTGGVPVWATPASGGMTNPMTAVGDIIIGGASGTATRLAASTNTFVLTLVSGSPAWAAPAAPSINLDALTDVIITTPANTQLLTYNGTNWVNAAPTGITQATADTLYVNVSGDTMTGTLTVNGGAVNVGGAAGTFRSTNYYTGANQRWGLLINNAAESGSNAGSDLIINRFTDAGAYLGTSISIVRSTGVIAFEAIPTWAGSPAMNQADADTRYVNVSGDTMTGGLTLSAGNLTLSGTSQKILGDFSTTGAAGGVTFQTSTVNGNTGLNIMPNGTGTIATVRFYASGSDPNNASLGMFLMQGGSAFQITSTSTGTGPKMPMTFAVIGGGTMTLHVSGGVSVLDSSDPAAGFFRIAGKTYATGHVGVGSISKSSWSNTFAVLDFFTGRGSISSDASGYMQFTQNLYNDGTNWRNALNAPVGMISLLVNGTIGFYASASPGAADSVYTPSQKMLIDAGSVYIDVTLNHRGTTLGFYNTTPAAKPTVTGARSSNAALTSLCTALATLGLITNSTTT